MSNDNNDPHIDRELDLSNTGRGVWLVKVPKYIANKWDTASGHIEVGKLKITRVPGQKAQVQLTLSEAVMCLKDPGEQSIPKEHHLDVSNVTRQTLGVFSHVVPTIADAVMPESDKLYMEGRNVQKLECKPNADSTYYKLKYESIKKASMTQRKVQQLAKVVPKFKPISVHRHDIEYSLKKKAEGKKMRDNKDVVLNMLFAAFEKYQYYNIKDLHRITKQPMEYLKEILKEVCNYNTKNPHKNMWELKPEYRHYKQEVSVEKNNKNNSDSN
ncbi:general transcription factor IIF subunit 2-like [Galleria mellonella]|uniref:General transcription factor IIF subunit 2 n=1 Tax=Galleria mellonella TaxID=7137 RepID=A0A6J1WX75_GALME|nr:general transcription factor IIF subunit 2-like [Galleria mellonella]